MDFEFKMFLGAAIVWVAVVIAIIVGVIALLFHVFQVQDHKLHHRIDNCTSQGEHYHFVGPVGVCSPKGT